MRTKGIGPQGLGLLGNNGYSIGSPAAPAKIGPLVAMAGKAIMGAIASKVVDKVASPGKFKEHKMYSKSGKEVNAKTNQEHLDLKEDGYGHTAKAETPAKKNDACYKKVAGRYKGGNSAYRSGAMVKCRKVGVANWGNKSK